MKRPINEARAQVATALAASRHGATALALVPLTGLTAAEVARALGDLAASGQATECKGLWMAKTWRRFPAAARGAP